MHDWPCSECRSCGIEVLVVKLVIKGAYQFENIPLFGVMVTVLLPAIFGSRNHLLFEGSNRNPGSRSCGAAFTTTKRVLPELTFGASDSLIIWANPSSLRE